MRVIGYIFLLALICISQTAWTANHQITGDASTQLAAGIRVIFISNLDKLANKDTANALRSDLNTDDDSKRTVKSIDINTANQIFSIFGLKDPNCDANKDGKVEGDELKCLSKIWKNFVPK